MRLLAFEKGISFDLRCPAWMGPFARLALLTPFSAEMMQRYCPAMLVGSPLAHRSARSYGFWRNVHILVVQYRRERARKELDVDICINLVHETELRLERQRIVSEGYPDWIGPTGRRALRESWTEAHMLFQCPYMLPGNIYSDAKAKSYVEWLHIRQRQRALGSDATSAD